MGTTRWFAIGLCAAGLLSSTATAQAPPPQRRGFWGQVGVGYGSQYEAETRSWNGGVGARIALGGALSNKLLIGLESEGWADVGPPTDVFLLLVTLTAAIRYYPSATAGFHVMAGGGLVARTAVGGSFVDYSRGGPQCVAGLGYDLRLARFLSVTPYGTFTAAFWGGGIETGYLMNLGVALTVH